MAESLSDASRASGSRARPVGARNVRTATSAKTASLALIRAAVLERCETGAAIELPQLLSGGGSWGGARVPQPPVGQDYRRPTASCLKLQASAKNAAVFFTMLELNKGETGFAIPSMGSRALAPADDGEPEVAGVSPVAPCFSHRSRTERYESKPDILLKRDAIYCTSLL